MKNCLAGRGRFLFASSSQYHHKRARQTNIIITLPRFPVKHELLTTQHLVDKGIFLDAVVSIESM